MSKRIIHTPEGVRDIYGKEYTRQLQLQETIRDVIKKYGYDDIQTPSFEFFDVFSKEIGTTPSQELYKFFDKENNTLVLRPDFTPAIARCASKYFMDETEPIRLCYLGNTFTNTNNLQGKLKEVTQMGVELINDDSVEADAEMISLVVDALKASGVPKFQIAIGEAEYFKGLCEEAGLDEETEKQLRAFVSGKNYFAVEQLLQDCNVSEYYKEIFLRIADIFGNMGSLAEARALVKNERSVYAIDRLEKLYQVLKLYQVEEYISFDLGMVSKYHYYTGVIFKAFTTGIGNAVVTGGRYDKLLGHFGKQAPAIGFAIVVDHLLEALMRQQVPIQLKKQKLVLQYDPNDEKDYVDKLQECIALRTAGEYVELKAASGKQ